MKSNGAIWALLLCLALTLACGSEQQGTSGSTGTGGKAFRTAIIGKWQLQEMLEQSEFKRPHETAEKKWGNLEIFPNNTLEFYSSGTQGQWNILADGRIKVISAYWGTFFLTITGDSLRMTRPDDQAMYIYKKIN
jgi:hypothetical protein